MYLIGIEMSDDFHKDLVILIWSLVPWYDDLCTRKVLQLGHLKTLVRHVYDTLNWQLVVQTEYCTIQYHTILYYTVP